MDFRFTPKLDTDDKPKFHSYPTNRAASFA
jgi:hypothetical protein